MSESSKCPKCGQSCAFANGDHMSTLGEKYQFNECGCTFVRKCDHAQMEAELDRLKVEALRKDRTIIALNEEYRELYDTLEPKLADITAKRNALEQQLAEKDAEFDILRRCVRCGAKYRADGRCERYQEGCQGGVGEAHANRPQLKRIADLEQQLKTAQDALQFVVNREGSIHDRTVMAKRALVALNTARSQEPK